MGRYKLVLYHQGKRIEKPVSDVAKAIERLKELQARDVRCRLIGRTDRSAFPPPRTVKEMRALGKWWCPYCRDWSYFSVPRYVEGAEVGSGDWMKNCQALQGIKVCNWCLISEQDFYVKRANGLWGHEPMKARRGSRK